MLQWFCRKRSGLRDRKRAELSAVTVHVLVVCGLQSQLVTKEKKIEELCNACTQKTQPMLFDVAEHLTQRVQASLFSDGKHESILDCVFSKTAALSHEQVVPKHTLLVGEFDLEMYTATPMVIVRQVKLEAADHKKLEKDFQKELGRTWQHFVEKVRQTCF